VVGHDPDGARILALAGHPFLVGALFAPQVLSSYDKPHPLFIALLRAAVKRQIELT
jgi:CTP synthase (UTP-ammonia lyase)